MRMPWHKSKELQLNLLDAEPEADVPDRLADDAPPLDSATPFQVAVSPGASEPGIPDGRPMLVAVTLLHEDANNPRTVFPEGAVNIARKVGHVRRHQNGHRELMRRHVHTLLQAVLRHACPMNRSCASVASRRAARRR